MLIFTTYIVVKSIANINFIFHDSKIGYLF